MTTRSVLISGASVAGPALAMLLARAGFDVTVVEIAPARRTGGYAIDFSGPAHLTVLDRMGLLPDLRARATGGRTSRFVDETGRTLFTLPPEFTGGDLELPRAELSELLHDRGSTVEYRYGDTITALHQTAGSVRVSFRDAPDQSFDLVIGADGMHSVVRGLAFAPEEECVTYLGYQVAGWDLPNAWDLKGEIHLHNRPGTLAGLSAAARNPARADAYALFADPSPHVGRADRHRRLEQVYAGQGWEVPTMLAAFPEATDVYFDQVARVAVPTWSTGRIALLGDAACGATLSGTGTGLAVVAAYVLARELTRTPDHAQAFARYEQIIRPYAARTQGGSSPAELLAPAGRLRLRLRDLILGNRVGRALALRAGGKAAPGPDLDDQ
ncbi:FAD-dependent monooxygenase [Symbioplanes lichenis]|uniref:FAD-dependent monooxygenase n=1 Tax=Symbioplanes lichenis TaxID=1629072 RepID=UPI002738359C|nr:FAD-dependent monooxygenase [Actinoplanes lichenis]